MKEKNEPIRLLLATHNKAKLGELTHGAKPLILKGIGIVSLDDLRITEDPAETGTTFEENAVLKARYYASLTGLPTLADDGGLTIDILNNEPGVHSKRWLGRDATDNELISYTLKQLEKVPEDQRTAALQTTLCYFNPLRNTMFIETGKILGTIAKKPSSNPSAGYPYRALFIVKEFGKYYDELTPGEHTDINHRLKALSLLLDKISIDLVE